MIALTSVRKGLKNLSLVGLSVIAAATVAFAATAGFPFNEDFSADNLKGADTTADWDIGTGILRMGVESDLTAMSVTRSPLGGSEDQMTSRDLVVADFNGDGIINGFDVSILRISSSSRTISSVSPEWEMASSTSPETSIPRSPCKASAGCMK